MTYGYETEIIFSKHKGHINEVVSELDTADLVITLGGDGTFNEAMRGNFARRHRLL